jgi:DNA-binding MarR family transcriptional regulator
MAGGLKKQGLITEETGAEDKRSTLLRLSKKGAVLIASLEPAWDALRAESALQLYKKYGFEEVPFEAHYARADIAMELKL